tara:strand:+ start:2015 stop:2125 length:111 start_codon:yes stop_codon:yes gene_type:complete
LGGVPEDAVGEIGEGGERGVTFGIRQVEKEMIFRFY